MKYTHIYARTDEIFRQSWLKKYWPVKKIRDYYEKIKE
jgi:hypothetical protein